MPDTDQPARWPYHIPLYTLGVLLGAGSLVCQVLMVAGFSTVLRPISVTLATLGGIIVAATFITRKLDAQHRQLLKASQEYADKRHAEAAELLNAMGTLAYDMRRVMAFAERGVGISHDLTAAIEGVQRQLETMESVGAGCECVALSKRLEELAAQQDTLAHLLADGALNVPNGDVYELGKRVGRDEALRERGEDQNP